MKNINTYIIEKQTTGAGKENLIEYMIKDLKANPDYKGKDKELWHSAGQFLYDYLKDLTPKDYEEIVKKFDLPDLRNSDKDEFSAAAVQGALALKLAE